MDGDAQAVAPGDAVLDVGLGAEPWTTLELAAALRARQPGLRVVGLERDPARCARAGELAGAALELVLGATPPAGPFRWIRVMNVLRDTPPDQLEAALLPFGACLGPSGLLLEGSSSHSGHVLAARTLRRGPEGLRGESLVFATDFSAGFSPAMFRGPLPVGLRLPWSPPNPAFLLIARWTRAWESTAGEPAERFVRSVAAAGGRVVGGAAEFPWTPLQGSVGATQPATR